jgi:hypothetical protein
MGSPNSVKEAVIVSRAMTEVNNGWPSLLGSVELSGEEKGA